MNTPLQTSEHQQRNPEKGALLWRLFRLVKNDTQDILNVQSNSPEETLMFMIYDWKFPQMKDNDNNGHFYRKHSGARDEWCMKIQSLQSFAPYGMDTIIRNLYESEKVVRWSNHDDFAFYEYLWEYSWRKFRVIFYNSCDYSINEWKKTFKSLLAEDQPIRICWY